MNNPLKPKLACLWTVCVWKEPNLQEHVSFVLFALLLKQSVSLRPSFLSTAVSRLLPKKQLQRQKTFCLLQKQKLIGKNVHHVLLFNLCLSNGNNSLGTHHCERLSSFYFLTRGRKEGEECKPPTSTCFYEEEAKMCAARNNEDTWRGESPTQKMKTICEQQENWSRISWEELPL